MPYIVFSQHYEESAPGQGVPSTEVPHRSRREEQKVYNEPGDKSNKLESLKERVKLHSALREAYPDDAVHHCSTLDESYYHFDVNNEEAEKIQKHRNKTQVVTRAAENAGQAALQDKNEDSYWPLLRVNQLWIWAVGESRSSV